MQIQSPFISQIPQCKLIMRRLRKKISKYTTAHKEQRKPRDQSHDIMSILKTRNLPNFVLETIKKRRTFDLLCLKNVVMSGESSLEEMKKLAINQESQIQCIFQEHKQRLRKPKERVYPKLQRRSTNGSSTQQDDNSSNTIDEDSRQLEKYFLDQHSSDKDGSISSHEKPVSGNFEEDGPGFHGKDFLSFRDEIYSEDEWLKF